jgi:hypothetical protein
MKILITIILGGLIWNLLVLGLSTQLLKAYYYKKFKKEKGIEKEEAENKKKDAILGAIHTNWCKLGEYGFSTMRTSDQAVKIKYDYGVALSGYIFVYTDKYSVYIDFNSFKSEDLSLVKELLAKKYINLLDTYSGYCLEAKKAVIDELYGGRWE